jgi:hypothetical protein
MDSPQRCKVYPVGDRNVSVLSGWESPHADETLDSFIHRTRPSKTSSSSAPWIGIHHDSREALVKTSYSGARNHDQDMAYSLFTNLVETKSVTAEALWNLGQACGWGCGKWMIFATHDSVDEIWEIIVRQVWAGNLGPSAKVAPGTDTGISHVVCIYCDPYWETVEVNRVLQALRKAGISRALNFKADIVTMMGINADNPWKVPVCFYTAPKESAQAVCKVQVETSASEKSTGADEEARGSAAKRRRTK